MREHFPTQTINDVIISACQQHQLSNQRACLRSVINCCHVSYVRKHSMTMATGHFPHYMRSKENAAEASMYACSNHLASPGSLFIHCGNPRWDGCISESYPASANQGDGIASHKSSMWTSQRWVQPSYVIKHWCSDQHACSLIFLKLISPSKDVEETLSNRLIVEALRGPLDDFQVNTKLFRLVMFRWNLVYFSGNCL